VKEFVPQSQLYGCWKGADQFANDFYQAALARRPAASELTDWTSKLAQAQGDAQLIAEAQALGSQVFKSAEYAARNPSDSGFVYDLYWAYMQRAPDQSGWNWWTSQITPCGADQTCRATKREDVRRAFDQSDEFKEKIRDLCGTSAAATDNGGVGYNFSTARLDPLNRTGGDGADPYSRNFNFQIPLVGLAGRAGLDLGLSLAYNSLVWTKDSTGIAFDADHGFPSPGFRLGFPVVQPRFYNPQTGAYAYMLVTPSGKRVELRQVGTSNVYESADSGYLQLTDTGSLSVAATDGTRLSFALMNGEFRCTQVKGRNGNYVSVSYTADGRITQVTDTLGSAVTFGYDSYQNLIKIEQQWKRETEANQTGVDELHTWATFGYTNLTLQPSFSNLAVVGEQPGTVVPVLSQVGLDDGSYYKFYYNQWGQVWKATHFAADSAVNGVPQDTHALSYTRLDLPGSDLQGATPQTDCPRFTQQRAWVENGVMDQSAELTTAYSLWSPDMLSCDTTAPDGTVFRDGYGTGWQKGMTLRAEVLSGGQTKKVTTTLMEHDGGTGALYPTNPRVKKITVQDASVSRSTEVTEFAAYGLPRVIKEYDSNGTTVLRRTEVEYKVDPSADAAYLNLRMIGLVRERRVYDETGALASKVSYLYDQSGTLVDQGAATQHDAGYGTGYVTRGNVTTAQQWDVKDAAGAANIEKRTAFNTDGSPVSNYVYDPAAPAQNVTQLEYTDKFSDGVNRNTFAYLTKITDPDGFTASNWYNYQTGAEFKSQTPQPNTQQNIAGPTITNYYDGAGRIAKIVNGVTGAYTEWDYPTNMTLVKTYTTIADNSIPAASQSLRAYSATALDGAGRTRGTARGLPNSTGGFAGERTLRNSMGRVEYQSNPTEMTTTNNTWTPAGDDANNGAWRWARQEYDWKGRPTVSTNQDGTQRITDYSGCGCSGGDTVTVRDEVGRVQKTYNDALGRPVKTEHMNLDGTTVYRTVRTDYNVLDQVKAVTQQAGTAGASQATTTEYDGYGRVWKTKAPQAVGPVVYEYYNDGRGRFVDDLREDRFDRLFEYDDMGGLKKAESGYKARQAPYPGNNTQNGPYNHYYVYDAFDNLTNRTGAYWYKESGETFTANYVNNRNQTQGWGYDNDGRLTQSVVQGSTSTYNNTYTYNAAGQRTDAGTYDGDGLQIKSADGTACYVRSTVLDGKVVSEVWSEAYNTLFEFGRKIRSFVYVGGEVLAEQKRTYFNKPAGEEWMVWKRHDPQGTSVHLNDYSTSSQNTPRLRQLALDAQGIATEAPDYVRLSQNQSYYTQSYSNYNYAGGGYTPTGAGRAAACRATSARAARSAARPLRVASRWRWSTAARPRLTGATPATGSGSSRARAC
jgi:YD repeat-containing protein